MEYILISLGVVVIAIGLVGLVVPVIPAGIAVALGSLLIAWGEDFEILSTFHLTFIFLLGAVSMIVDQMATIHGARRAGSSKAGIWGALIGGVIGIFFGPFGIIGGPLLGAVAFELISGSTFKKAFQSGGGTLLGQLYALFGKLLIILIQISIILFAYF